MTYSPVSTPITQDQFDAQDQLGVALTDDQIESIIIRLLAYGELDHFIEAAYAQADAQAQEKGDEPCDWPNKRVYLEIEGSKGVHELQGTAAAVKYLQDSVSGENEAFDLAMNTISTLKAQLSSALRRLPLTDIRPKGHA